MNDNVFDTGNSLIDEIEGGGGIRLPFPHCYITIFNGNKFYKADNPLQRFGGFRTNKAEDASGSGVNPFPMTEITHITDSGAEVPCHATATMKIAVAGYRTRWTRDSDNEYRLVYEQGFNKQQIQILALANIAGVQFPIVLTRRGYAAGWLKEMVGIHSAIVRSADARNADNKPLTTSCFWMDIGVWGEAQERQAGKGENVKKITALKFNPETHVTSADWKAKLIDGLSPREWARREFIGKGQLERVKEIRGQSEEWLLAWKNGVADQQPPAKAAPVAAQPPDMEDDFPF